MGKSTISMGIFNSYFDITRGYIRGLGGDTKMSLTSLGFGGHLRYQGDIMGIPWCYSDICQLHPIWGCMDMNQPQFLGPRWSLQNGPSDMDLSSLEAGHILRANNPSTFCGETWDCYECWMSQQTWEYFTNEPTLWFEFLCMFSKKKIGVTGLFFAPNLQGFCHVWPLKNSGGLVPDEEAGEARMVPFGS